MPLIVSATTGNNFSKTDSTRERYIYIFNRHLLRYQAKGSACCKKESPPRMAGLQMHTLPWKGLVLRCPEQAASPAPPPLPCSLTVRGGGQLCSEVQGSAAVCWCEQHPKDQSNRNLITEAQPPPSCVEGKIEVIEVGRGEEGHGDPIILREVSKPTVLG